MEPFFNSMFLRSVEVKCSPEIGPCGSNKQELKMETSKAGHLMSLAALQRQDPYINNLLDVTGQVALYNFNSKANEWVSHLTPSRFNMTAAACRANAFNNNKTSAISAPVLTCLGSY